MSDGGFVGGKKEERREGGDGVVEGDVVGCAGEVVDVVEVLDFGGGVEVVFDQRITTT